MCQQWLLELQSPRSFRACFFVFIVYSLFVAYYPRPIVYRVHPPRFLLFILIQLRHFSFIITTIYIQLHIHANTSDVVTQSSATLSLLYI